MSNIDIITRVYQTWNIFDEWSLASGLKLTEYDKAMFQWMAIFGAAQEPSQWNELAPGEVHSFIDKLMNGEYFCNE